MRYQWNPRKRFSESELDAEKDGRSNKSGRQKRNLADALNGADIFVGVSAPNIVTKEMVASMNKDAILFAMANPVPEIMPDLAKEAGAKLLEPDVQTSRTRSTMSLLSLESSKALWKDAQLRLQKR